MYWTLEHSVILSLLINCTNLAIGDPYVTIILKLVNQINKGSGQSHWHYYYYYYYFYSTVFLYKIEILFN